MNIKELSQREDELMALTEKLIGTMEEKTVQLEMLGIFKDYKFVHDQYTSKIYDNVEGLEALKRAVFIQWYSVSEPSCFTGIDGLNSENEKNVFKAVEQRTIQNLLDDEFKSMLVFYYSISDWYFEGFEELKQTLEVIKQINSNTDKATLNLMDDRGQMGNYWSSLDL